MLKRFLFYTILVAICISLFSCTGSKKEINIGIISIIEHPALDAVRNGFKDFLTGKGYKENINIKYDYRNAKGRLENADQIVAGFIGNKVNLILAIGTPVAKVAAEKTKNIPIMIAAITDPVSAGLVESMDKPGGNVTGTSDMNPVRDQLELIKNILPITKKVGILYNPGESNSVAIMKIAKQIAKDLSIDLVEATATSTSGVQAAVASLIGKVNAVYMPTDNTMAAAIDVIIDVCSKNKLPFFSSDEESVKQPGGAIASISVNYYQLGRQTGMMAVEVLKGAKPATVAVEYQKTFDLSINNITAAKLGITVPAEILKKAKVY